MRGKEQQGEGHQGEGGTRVREAEQMGHGTISASLDVTYPLPYWTSPGHRLPCALAAPPHALFMITAFPTAFLTINTNPAPPAFCPSTQCSEVAAPLPRPRPTLPLCLFPTCPASTSAPPHLPFPTP